MSLKSLACAIILFVVVHANDQCCYPDKLSGDVEFSGRKMYSFNIDYTNNRIIENWNGKMGTDYIYYDLAEGQRYRVSRSGCKKSEISNIGNYAQCPPSDAEESDGGDDLTLYKYMSGTTTVEKYVHEVSCLPAQITKTAKPVKGRSRTVTLTYTNVEDALMSDPFSNLVDFSGCE